MSLASSLIPELEDVVQRGTPERRTDMLKRMTSLFLEGAPRFNDDHVRLFDDVFVQLIEEIEAKARAELSRRIAPLANAPMEILRRLAHDDDISVAGPVLAESPRLVTNDLLPVARSKGQAHLFAISGRDALDETLTDVLVHRGDNEVIRKVASNMGARLSPAGYSAVVQRAQNDGVVAEAVVQREDLPDHLFRELLTRATEVVQRRLLAAARPETQGEIRRVLASVSSQISAAGTPARDFGPALERVNALHKAGKLGEREIADFAGGKEYEDMVAGLSVIGTVPLDVIARLIAGERPDPVLILCKALGFAWTTTRAVILARPNATGKSNASLEAAYSNFDKLSASTAQRVVRFWQASQTPLARAS